MYKLRVRNAMLLDTTTAAAGVAIENGEASLLVKHRKSPENP